MINAVKKANLCFLICQHVIIIVMLMQEKMYDEGKELSENAPTKSEPGSLLILLIILVILAFIVNYKG